LVLCSGERINVDVVAAASTRHVGKLADYCCILAENGNRLLEAGRAFFVPLIEQYRPDWLSTERRGIVRNGSRGIPREREILGEVSGARTRDECQRLYHF
jgi:hypothetical protein